MTIEQVPSVRVSSAVGLERENARVGSGFHGYVPRSERFHRFYNATLALFFLIVISPTFLLLMLALLLTQGRDIFYGGPRLGKDRRIFTLYKFRTLDSDKARKLTADKVLPEGTDIETPLGRYLRNSRLDELPQLINVLKGDMNLSGPRPVRPEIAKLYAGGVENYDSRFEVKPGLVGHTQAWFGHGSSKRIRARLNHAHCRAPVSYLHEIGIQFLVAFHVGRASLSGLVSRALPIDPEEIAQARARHFRAKAIVPGDVGSVPVLALGRDFIELPARAISGGSEVNLTLVCQLPRRRILRVPLKCRLAVAGPDGLRCQYTPRSDYAKHRLDRYGFGLVVVPPKGAFRNGASARIKVLRTRLGALFADRNYSKWRRSSIGVENPEHVSRTLLGRADTPCLGDPPVNLSGPCSRPSQSLDTVRST